jgi:hypothetical protein
MAKALENLNQPGKIVTIDVVSHEAKRYWNCIADKNGPQTRAELLTDYASLIKKHIIFLQGDSRLQLKKIYIPRIHFAFLDGAHSYKYVMNDFYYIKDKQERGDIVFFDDYTPNMFPGVVKAVDEICQAYSYEKEIVNLSDQRGYAIARKK